MRSRRLRPSPASLVLVAALLAVVVPLRAQAPAAPPGAPATTVIVVRHAEKAADDPRDPSLSPEGQARARALLSALEQAQVKAVYSTQYRRTRETGEPLARHLGLPVVERPVDASNAATYARDLAREILSGHPGESVLVVGHSNTVPQLVQALSGQAVAPIAESEYDRLYVVVLPPSGPVRLLRARYAPEGT